MLNDSFIDHELWYLKESEYSSCCTSTKTNSNSVIWGWFREQKGTVIISMFIAIIKKMLCIANNILSLENLLSIIILKEFKCI